MSVACDFCLSLADRKEEVIFVANPSKLVHICEECVNTCSVVIAKEKSERQSPAKA